MRVRVLFFAAYRERVGRGEVEVDLPEPATAADLLQALWALGEPFDSLPAAPVMAVNRSLADSRTALHHGDEVALIPPVAGG